MSKRYKRKGISKFIMLDAYVKRSAAWKAMTPIERAAYLEVKWRYNGTNNGRIGLGCRELADELNMGRDTAARALDGLQAKGFIVKIKASAFNLKNRAVTEWRLTEYTCDVTGELATKEFTRWSPEEKTTVAPIGRTVRPIGHPSQNREVKARQNGGKYAPQSHPSDCNANPQSHPSDTYRYTTRGASDAA